MAGIDIARQATVSICNRAGVHRGQGLLLDLEEEGLVVLTCHHVIAPLQPDDLCIVLEQGNGQPKISTPAQYDDQRSHPDMDAVVLHVNGIQAPPRPLLLTMNPDIYAGRLPAIGITYLTPNTFDALVTACTPLDIKVREPGKWPHPPATYHFPFVYRLFDPSYTREGISGSVVVCEGGVLGLVHFARSSGPTHKREAYLVPLTVWSDGWPKLDELLEPLIDGKLRGTATIKRSRNLKIGLETGSDIVIASYRPDIYEERQVDLLASEILAKNNSTIIIGKPRSGKTRLAYRLLQKLPEALVVIPHTFPPPHPFEASGLTNHDLILFLDDIHRTIRTHDPYRWKMLLSQIAQRRCLVICTSRDGEDWMRVRDYETQLLDDLRQEVWVFTSKVGDKGEDFPDDQAWELAQAIGIGMSHQEFIEHRFDGTPGSVTLNLDAMKERYDRLRNKYLGEVSMSRLLDSAKLLYSANQPRIQMKTLRMVAEKIRGSGLLSNELWETLQRHTQMEGFGQIDSTTGEFLTYRPYIEECIEYTPSLEELEALISNLADLRDYIGLCYLSETLLMKYESSRTEEAARISIKGGEKSAYSVLGLILTRQRGREVEAEEAYRYAIDAGDTAAYNNLGLLLARQPVRKAEAEQIYKMAIKAGVKSAYINLGNLLAGENGREAEAEQAYKDAIIEGFEAVAYYNLGLLLEKQLERSAEAKQLFRIAIESGYKATYFRRDTLPGRRQEYEDEPMHAFQVIINAEEKKEYYYSLDAQTIKTRIDILAPTNRHLLAAYRKFISDFDTEHD